MQAREERAPRATAACLCGAVRYRVHGALRDVVICHCGQCRRAHGHVAGYTSAAAGDLVLAEDRGLTWYRSSKYACRGFCSTCGCSLFWRPEGEERVAIAAGTLDPPTGLKTIGHVYTADAGDYYDIADGLPQKPAGMG